MYFLSPSRKKVQLELIPTDVRIHDRVPFVHTKLAFASRLVSDAARSLFTIGLVSVAGAEGRVRQPQANPPAAFRDESGLVRMVYKEAVIRFRPRTSERRISQILKEHGYKVRNRNRFVPNQFIVFHTTESGTEVLKAANDWAEMVEVVFATPNFVSQYRRAKVPDINDEQWYLHNMARYEGQKNGEDVGALEAWKTTTGDAKVTVALLDDGVDIDHPNLSPNIFRKPDKGEPKDFYGCDFYVPDDQLEHFNPRPKTFNYPYDQLTGNDIHGTACAGIIAAPGKGGGAVGVAPGCKILPVKIFHAEKLTADERVADAIRYSALHADVLSCSWFTGYNADVDMALEDSKTLGRDGKGAVLVFSSGNDGGVVKFPARHAAALAVGASTDKATFATYSSAGPEQSVVAPSSGGVRGIFTTDVSLPGRGFNPGDLDKGGTDGLHTNSFGGTSAAAPLVAGIAALILSANPQLDRLEIQDIVQSTAEKIGTGYDSKGHSEKLGYGRVNAAAAVSEAAKRRGPISSKRR
jgi:subtilisin family serine protease